MALVWLIPVIVCHLFLAAHFLDLDNLLFLVISASMPLLLFIPQEWPVRLVQTVLFVGGMEWIRTAIERYSAQGGIAAADLALPGAAALACFLTLYVFNSGPLRARYHCKPLFPGRE